MQMTASSSLRCLKTIWARPFFAPFVSIHSRGFLFAFHSLGCAMEEVSWVCQADSKALLGTRGAPLPALMPRVL